MNAFSFYTEALARSTDCGLIFDRQGTILYLNHTLSTMYGIEPEVAVGQSIYVFLDEDEIPRAREIVDQLFSDVHLGEYRLKFTRAHDLSLDQTYIRWRVQEVYSSKGEKNFILALGSLAGAMGEHIEYKEEMSYLIGMDGSIIQIHPGICAMCGYTHHQVLSMNTADFYFNPGDSVRILNKLRQQGEIINDQITLKCKDGTPRTFRFNSHIVSRDGQPVVSGYFVQRDFTYTRKLVHDFSKIINALPDIAWVAGRDHSIVCANDAYCQFLGSVQEEVLGKTVYDFLPESKARAFVNMATIVFEERREIITPMLPHFKDSGVWFRAIYTPIFNDSRNEVIGLLGIYQNISHQVSKENAYLDGITTSRDSVFVLDTQCRIIRHRGKRLRPGATPGEGDQYRHLDLKIVFDIIHPKDLERAQGFIRQEVQTKIRHQGEFRIRRASGGYALVLVQGVYNDEFFGEGRIYVVVRDISDIDYLKRPEKVLERLKHATGARTNKDLASFLHVGATSISNAKKNQKIPSDWLFAVGVGTGFSLDWLMTGRGTEKREEVGGGSEGCV
ncbi:MAG: PAS domain S-box protein [Desulfoplanes sp.]|nr:PAS domain S-box protein [Desulfoplanes sp.]